MWNNNGNEGWKRKTARNSTEMRSQFYTRSYRTVWSTVGQISTVHITVQCSTWQHSSAQHRTLQYSAWQYRTVQYNTEQYSTAHHSAINCVTYCTSRRNHLGQHKALHGSLISFSERCYTASEPAGNDLAWNMLPPKTFATNGGHYYVYLYSDAYRMLSLRSLEQWFTNARIVNFIK